jgi:hypothetical protein
MEIVVFFAMGSAFSVVRVQTSAAWQQEEQEVLPDDLKDSDNFSQRRNGQKTRGLRVSDREVSHSGFAAEPWYTALR